jgi:ABC-2 type transport system permease protein
MTTALSHSWYISLRHLRHLARQPWWIGISLAQPLVYLLLFGAAFREVAEIPGFSAESYIDFFTPGIVVVTALFSGGWAGMGMIRDLDAGVVDRLLVSPVRPGALIAGGLMQQAIVTVLQSLIVVGLGIAAGASFPGGVTGVAVLIAVAVLLAAAFGALSMALSLHLRKEESVVGAVQMLLLPLTFISSVWMPRELLPEWIQDASRFNPLEWATQAGREAVTAAPDWSYVLTQGAYLLAVALAGAWLATRAFRAYQRSV